MKTNRAPVIFAVVLFIAAIILFMNSPTEQGLDVEIGAREFGVETSPNLISIPYRDQASRERDVLSNAHEGSNPLAQEGSVVFLDTATLKPPVGTSWKLVPASDDAQPLTVTVPESGRVGLKAGSWSIHSLRSNWAALRAEVVVRQGESHELWAVQVSGFSVEVRDSAGHPVGQALVTFRPELDRPRYFWDDPHAFERRTDVLGRVHVVPQSSNAGILSVVADGFAPAVRARHGLGLDPVQVTLHREARPVRHLRILDGQGQEPISQARLTTTFGGVSVVSDASGNIELPSWISEDQLIHVSATGYYPVHLCLDELPEPGTLRLFQAVSMTVQAVDGRSQPRPDAVVSAQIASLPEGLEGTPLVPVVERDGDEGLHKLIAPHGARVKLQAIAGMCESGETHAMVGESDQRVFITLEASAKVSVQVMSSDGKALGRARARMRVDPARWLEIEADRSGVIELPITNAIREIRIEADGFAPAVYAPREKTSAAGDVRATVVLEPSLWMRMKLQDVEGLAVSGRELLAIPHQEGWPSSPARNWSGWIWERKLPPSVAGISDGTGLAELVGLSRGRYEVIANLPDVADPQYWSLLPIQRLDVWISESGDVTWTLEKLQRVHIEVYERGTGLAISPITVSLDGGATGFRKTVQSHYWEGWIEADHERLMISADGFAVHELPLGDRISTPTTPYEVELSPAGVGYLVVEGRNLDLVGSDLKFDVLSGTIDSPDEHTHYLGEHQVHVEDPGSIPIRLSRSVGLSLEFQDIQGPQGEWTFVPNTIRWRAGEEHRVMLVPTTSP